LDRSEQEILHDTLKYAVSEVVKRLLADHELCQSQIHVDTGFDVYDRQQSEIETPGPSCIMSDLGVDLTLASISFGTISTSSVTSLDGEPLSRSFNLFPICKDGFSTSLHLPQSTVCESCQSRRHGVSLNQKSTSNFPLRPPSSKPPATQTTLLPSMSQLPGDLRLRTAEKAGAGAYRDGSHPALSYDDPGSPYSLEYRSMFGTVDDWP
jgi:hypothetical protein